MLTLTICTLKDVSVYDLDNGNMVMAVDRYAHNYNDMTQLATNLLEYADSQTTEGWEGNEAGEINIVELEESEDVNQIISTDGTFTGKGGAYIGLIRALVAQMHDDYIYLA